MKKIFLIVSFLILITTTAFAVIENKAGEVIGQMGTTFNERSGKTEKVEKGYIITMNDFLQTGEDGGMIIKYVDDTKFTMGPNTELIIDEFAFDTSKVPIIVAMSTTVNVGTFTYESGQISNLGGSVEINTASATITVQGTAFSGTVTPSGHTTITLLPDSSGDVGQVTVANEAGATTITAAYTSVTVLSDSLAPTPPSPLNQTQIKDLFDLDTNEEIIEENFEDQKDRKEATKKLDNFDKQEDIKIDTIEIQEQNFDVEVTEEVAGNLEQEIMTEELTIVETAPIEDLKIVEDIKVEEKVKVETTPDKVTEDVITDDTVNTEIDTSYYDQWDEYAYDEEYGWVDEDNKVSVWDASGEVKMDYEDSKKMYAEMDQAYYDAIGCEGDCNWETIDWDNINWDEVDWEEYDKKVAKTMESFGLEAYNYDDLDVTDDVFEDVEENTALVEEDNYEDIDWDNYNYYEDEDGPFLITGEEDWCKDASWCDAEYVENSNKWAQADWDLNTKYDKWNSESKALFEEVHLSWYDMDMKEAPKPWTIPALKDKYIKDWTWDDWDIWWKEFDEWYYSDYYDNWESTYEEISLEEEYAFEDDLLTAEEWEIEWLATITFEADCTYFGYYWDAANQSCGFTWVDNSEVNIKVKSSGEKINYETGEITQTITTTTDGVSDSVTRTGRYSTLNNTADVNVSTGSNNWHEYTRTHEGHTFHIHTGGSGVNSGNDAIQKFDMMVIQEQETQSVIAGSNGATITIIQTD